MRETGRTPTEARSREPQNKPRVSIVIVNWNTRQLLLDCLARFRTSAHSLPLEVIVVDNGSMDDSVAAVRREFDHVTIITNTRNVGYSSAHAQAFERVESEYVLLVNPDALVGDGALERMVELADEHPGVGAIGCRLAYPDGASQPNCFRFPNLRGVMLASLGLPRLFPDRAAFNWDGYGGRDWSRVQAVDFAVGCCLLLRTSAARSVGWFDTRYFMYGEEADLCYRLAQVGASTLYCPDAQAVHLGGGSAIDRRTRDWAYEAKQRAILFFLHEHRGATQAWFGNLFMLAGMLPRICVWALDAVRPRRARRDGRLGNARVLAFHLRALLSPAVLRTSWARPEDAPR